MASVTFDPNHLMTVSSQPFGHALVPGRPPGPADTEYHYGPRFQHAAKSFLPIPGVNQFRTNRLLDFLCKCPQFHFQHPAADGGFIQGKRIWNNVYVDQTQTHVQIVPERSGVTERRLRQLRIADWNDDLKCSRSE